VNPELFSAVRRPERRWPLILAVAAWVVAYAVLSFYTALAFESDRRRGWMMVAITGVALVLPVVVTVWWFIPRLPCKGCGRQTRLRRIREIPGYLADEGRYVRENACPMCWRRMYDAMESDLFAFVDPAKRLEPFLKLLGELDVEVPPTEDWRTVRPLLREFVKGLRDFYAR
jgi:hypothetical protein